VATFTARTAVFAFVSVRDAIIAGLDWLRPRAYALALLLRRGLVASWIWLAEQSRTFAALRPMVVCRLGLDARQCRDRIILGRSDIDRGCHGASALARANLATNASHGSRPYATVRLRSRHRVTLDRSHLAQRRL
jgi:hypothetical protein